MEQILEKSFLLFTEQAFSKIQEIDKYGQISLGF